MLLMPKFDFYQPRDLRDLCNFLAEFKGDAKIIAGGTDVLVNLKKQLIRPKYLADIGRIREISEIETQANGVSIGANLIVAKLAEFDLIKKKFPIVAQAASVLGSPIIRNRATIGGNIVTARPAADIPPSLIALGAKLRLTSKKRNREVNIDKFLIGPGKTALKDDEVLTGIIVDDPSPYTGGSYKKLGHRNSLEISIVAVAAVVSLDAPNGVINNAKIILSAVAPRAIHAISAEKALIGEKPKETLIEKAARLAMDDSSPITDIRGGAEYRRHMVGALTKKALKEALAAIKKGTR